MSEAKHSVRFPGENDEYRDARNALLEDEIKLRRDIEAVGVKRRALPLGGKVPTDYLFEAASGDGSSRAVHLSDLFSPGKDTLIIYSFMYGPKMAQPCVSCTSILDAMDGESPHVVQRVNLAVVARSPIARIMEFATGRGWRNLRLLSAAGNTYNQDYHAESPDGDQWPALNVFVRREGAIYHFYNTELLYTPSESGQDGRHVDMIWPLWNLFDLTPEGRGEKWYPKLSYEIAPSS
jgi:predicted dithiol-disulfide oxidoreductase (DUF899 family)